MCLCLNFVCMKSYSQLLNNIIGQLNGVSRMIENDDECFDILTQLKAAKSALNSFSNKFLQEKFLKCLDKGEESKEEVCRKFFKEIIT